MLLFSRRKEQEVQSFLLKVVNNSNTELLACQSSDGPRGENRVDLMVVVMIVPLDGKRPRLDRSFPAVTKDFTTTGLSVVLDEAKALDEVIVGFRWQQGMTYVRGEARRMNPIGAGFYLLGVKLHEMAHPADYPGLDRAAF